MRALPLLPSTLVCWACLDGGLARCRSQVQLQSTVRTSVRAVLGKTLQVEGVRGLYRGFVPNALKNLPNKGAIMSRSGQVPTCENVGAGLGKVRGLSKGNAEV